MVVNAAQPLPLRPSATKQLKHERGLLPRNIVRAITKIVALRVPLDGLWEKCDGLTLLASLWVCYRNYLLIRQLCAEDTRQVTLICKTQMAELCASGIDFNEVCCAGFLIENEIQAMESAEHEFPRQQLRCSLHLFVLYYPYHSGCAGRS